jgi:hypothetical protein
MKKGKVIAIVVGVVAVVGAVTALVIKKQMDDKREKDYWDDCFDDEEFDIDEEIAEEFKQQEFSVDDNNNLTL